MKSKDGNASRPSGGASRIYPVNPTLECEVVICDPATGTEKVLHTTIDDEVRLKAYSSRKSTLDIITEDLNKQGIKEPFVGFPKPKVAKELSAKIAGMTKDKNWPETFLRENFTMEQFGSMGVVQRTLHCHMLQDFIKKEFHGDVLVDHQVTPEDPVYRCIRDNNRQEAADHIKNTYLSIPENRDNIKAKAKIAAENRKLLDKYLETLDFTTISFGFDEMAYQMVCETYPMSADDFVAAEYLAGVMFYWFASQVMLQVSPPDDDCLGDYAWLFMEDELLAWIDEIEAASEVTGSAVS